MQQIDWQTLAEGRTDASQLAEMRREWPYFVWPDLMALEHGVAEAGQAQALRARIALATGDPEALARVLDPDTDFADFYPDMQPVRLTTDDTIDTFLNRFGNTGDDKETDLLTRMIFTPAGSVESPESIAESRGPAEPDTPDKSDAAQAPDPTASRIDAFLATSRQPTRTPEALMHLEPADPPADNVRTHQGADAPKPAEPTASQSVASAPAKPSAGSSLSLSLARMMIKNHNYAKALEILNKVDLEDKEKSIIFADQIRFLRKLIIIQEHQNR
jgi:hypothetical protein